MQLAMIGLGRMGANMVRRLIKGGHACVVFDMSPKAVADLVRDKAVGAASLVDLVRKLVHDDPKALRLIDGAILGAERGATLTKRMLAFARRQELKPETVNVPLLVDSMVEMLCRSLGPGIEIVTDFAPDMPATRVDPNQLELALLNLALNAATRCRPTAS